MNDGYELIKYVNSNFELDVRISPKENTIWLTLDEMSELFTRDKSVISRHINNIFNDGELDEAGCVAFFATELNKYDPRTGKDRKTIVSIKYYNLDVIISVGYRVNSIVGIQFRKWANSILSEYLLKGYAIDSKRTLITNENYARLINKVESLDERVSVIEKQGKEINVKKGKLFFNGQFYDAYTFIQSLFENANSEIIIINNYIDRSVLDRLIVKKENVKVVIYTNIDKSRLIDYDIDNYNKQYGNLELFDTKTIHDRYIIIDKERIFHLGYSIKDLGKKVFSISESDKELIKELLNALA